MEHVFLLEPSLRTHYHVLSRRGASFKQGAGGGEQLNKDGINGHNGQLSTIISNPLISL